MDQNVLRFNISMYHLIFLPGEISESVEDLAKVVQRFRFRNAILLFYKFFQVAFIAKLHYQVEMVLGLLIINILDYVRVIELLHMLDFLDTVFHNLNAFFVSKLQIYEVSFLDRKGLWEVYLMVVVKIAFVDYPEPTYSQTTRSNN